MKKRLLRGLCIVIGVLLVCVIIRFTEVQKASAGAGISPITEVVYDIDDIEIIRHIPHDIEISFDPSN